MSWEGTAYRATSYDVPLWADPNRRAGRWNVPGEGCTQYLCDSPDAAFAEVLRSEGIRDERSAQMLHISIWEMRVSEGAMVDYSSFELAEQAGFDPDALVSDDRERCQAEARWLREQGAVGILAPSAALPTATSVTLFGPRVAARWDSPTGLASVVPCRKLVTGAPPVDLLHRVRHFGEAHAGLLEHRERRRGTRS